MSTLAQNVIRGWTKLNEYDTKWFLQVDPDFLLMKSTRECVVGQYFSAFSSDPYPYWDGLRHLGIDEEYAYDYGFDPFWSWDNEDGGPYYDDRIRYNLRVLTRMWQWIVRRERARLLAECKRNHPSYKD